MLDFFCVGVMLQAEFDILNSERTNDVAWPVRESEFGYANMHEEELPTPRRPASSRWALCGVAPGER